MVGNPLEDLAFISIHAPREGSDWQAAGYWRDTDISIHAPREGSDKQEKDEREKERSISIHAPREGSDGCGNSRYFKYKEFLSTLPARGATRSCSFRPVSTMDFYPRSPRGERPSMR